MFDNEAKVKLFNAEFPSFKSLFCITHADVTRNSWRLAVELNSCVADSSWTETFSFVWFHCCLSNALLCCDLHKIVFYAINVELFGNNRYISARRVVSR